MCKNGNPFQTVRKSINTSRTVRSPSASLGGMTRSAWDYRAMQPELVRVFSKVKQVALVTKTMMRRLGNQRAPPGKS